MVGGKLDAGALLEKLGVDHDAVERGRRAGLLSALRGFTPDEREPACVATWRSVYDIFLRRVEAGRKLTRADLARVAQGRVWSGARALALGLVDALGGPLEAIREARSRAGLAADEAGRARRAAAPRAGRPAAGPRRDRDEPLSRAVSQLRRRP